MLNAGSLGTVSSNIKSITGAILILLFVGALSGTWLLSGIIPSMIYYGLQILHPSILLILHDTEEVALIGVTQTNYFLFPKSMQFTHLRSHSTSPNLTFTQLSTTQCNLTQLMQLVIKATRIRMSFSPVAKTYYLVPINVLMNNVCPLTPRRTGSTGM